LPIIDQLIESAYRFEFTDGTAILIAAYIKHSTKDRNFHEFLIDFAETVKCK